MKSKEVRRGFGVRYKLFVMLDRSILQWTAHVEHMNDERLNKSVYDYSLDCRRIRGRLCFR